MLTSQFNVKLRPVRPNRQTALNPIERLDPVLLALVLGETAKTESAEDGIVRDQGAGGSEVAAKAEICFA